MIALLWILPGFFLGMIFFAHVQSRLEAGYVRNGIARLDGKFYRLERIRGPVDVGAFGGDQ